VIASVGEGWGSMLFGSEVSISGSREVGLHLVFTKRERSKSISFNNLE
jgi:hypothetical protein